MPLKIKQKKQRTFLVLDEMEAYFDALGREFYTFHQALAEQPEIRFCLTEEQHLVFNTFFIQLQDKYLALHGRNFIATIRRMALIAFRLAMILTTLCRMDSGDFSQRKECRDDDFQRVLSMTGVLVQHSGHVFSQLPTNGKSSKAKNRKEQFLNLLPLTFTRLDYINMAKSLSISDRTADAYILNFCDMGLILREQRGIYTNLSLSGKV